MFMGRAGNAVSLLEGDCFGKEKLAGKVGEL